MTPLKFDIIKFWVRTRNNLTKLNYFLGVCFVSTECVQSWINAYDTSQGDATLTFLEGSNNFHLEFRNHFKPTNPDDWVILTRPQLDWYTNTKGCVRTNIKCPAGSLVLWDSRTIHCGKEPDSSRPQPNFRCAVYLCYTPRKLGNSSELNKKIEAWENMRTTSHCPHKPKLFPVNPNTWGKPIPNIVQIPRPQISDLGYRLIGYETKPQE